MNRRIDEPSKWYRVSRVQQHEIPSGAIPAQPDCYLNCYSTIIYLHVHATDLHNRIVPLVQICGIIGARYTGRFRLFHYRKTRNSVIDARREQTTTVLAEISAQPESVVSFPAFCGHLTIRQR